jgi:hypothetical protein
MGKLTETINGKVIGVFQDDMGKFFIRIKLVDDYHEVEISNELFHTVNFEKASVKLIIEQ